MTARSLMRAMLPVISALSSHCDSPQEKDWFVTMKRKQLNMVWGFVLVLLGGFFLAEQVGVIDDLSADVWALLFAAASLLFFASYFINGTTQWGWLFPATIGGGLAAIIWLGERGYDGDYLGSLIIACVSLPFWVGFLVNRKENWWALIPGWITAAIAAVVLLSEVISGELMAAFILFSVALPFFAVYTINRQHWWALIPGGIVASVGLMLLVLAPVNRLGFQEASFVSVMFLGIALTFFIIWLLRGKAPTGWAIYPAAGFAALALWFLLIGMEISRYWPVVLILGGGWLLIDAARRPRLEG